MLIDVVQETRAEKLVLEKAVMHPQQCPSVDQVPMALERWTTALQAYYDAGGDDMNDERKKGSILKILPWRIQEKVLWDFDDFKTSDAS